ncbi:FAD-binding oxidoreductase [Enterobacter sp. UNJFSC 003]|uniref:NAD(P)/FAD-dependent oxidoreductase n=1 Tax=Enterobacter sp. UNJFSC 003 TaxID=3122077 RepID=UPI002EB5503D|nr:FAD-binding oxidoreductase [Serratia liquefaciens]
MTRKKRIVVVGAGITGVSIAWHIAHREFDVTLVEQDVPASGATGSAFGWLTGAVRDDAADVFIRRIALADWHRLEEHIPELHIKWSGSLSYGAASESCLQDERLLDKAEIARLEPGLSDPPSQARYAAKDGAIDAANATRLLLEKACEKGVVLNTQTTVTDLCMTEGRVTGVLTSQGKLDADCVVLACGTGIPALTERVGIPVPVLSSPAILLRFTVPQRVVKTIVSGDDIEVRQAHYGDLLAAEDYPASGNVRETVEAAQRAVRSRLTGAETAALIQHSVGERPVIQDGYPVLGFTDGSRTLYVASMHPAVTCAATIGRLVSEALCDGQSDEIPQCYRPSRFSAL